MASNGEELTQSISQHSSKWEHGAAIRSEVLGTEYVSQASSDWAGTSELEDLVIEFAWGSVWSRPGLDRPTRSLLTVAVLTAMNRAHELELHVGGALRNGCTLDQLVEVAIHCAPYCGIPAAVDSVRTIKAVHDSNG